MRKLNPLDGFTIANTAVAPRFPWAWLPRQSPLIPKSGASQFTGSYSLLFNPQFQSFKLLLGHALQSHRCGQIQSGNVFHFVAACYLATEFLYFWISAHFQKHFIGIGDGQRLFNHAMLNQNAMIRRYCQGRWMGLRSALVLFL